MSERNQQSERTVGQSFAALQTVCTNTQQSLASVSPKYQPQASGLTGSVNVEEECVKCLEVVQRKLSWARSALEGEQDPQLVTSYLKVITSCVEAITVLRKFSL